MLTPVDRTAGRTRGRTRVDWSASGPDRHAPAPIRLRSPRLTGVSRDRAPRGRRKLARGAPGQERDVETGLDYFHARQLRVDLGRFTTPDPIADLAWTDGTLGATSAYAYALNNPLGFVDPSGASWISVLVHLARQAWDALTHQYFSVTVVGAMPADERVNSAGLQLTLGSVSAGNTPDPGGDSGKEPKPGTKTSEECLAKVQAAVDKNLKTRSVPLGPTQGAGIDSDGKRGGAYN